MPLCEGDDGLMIAGEDVGPGVAMTVGEGVRPGVMSVCEDEEGQ